MELRGSVGVGVGGMPPWWPRRRSSAPVVPFVVDVEMQTCPQCVLYVHAPRMPVSFTPSSHRGQNCVLVEEYRLTTRCPHILLTPVETSAQRT
jgi:hypothetical protein